MAGPSEAAGKTPPAAGRLTELAEAAELSVELPEARRSLAGLKTGRLRAGPADAEIWMPALTEATA